MQKFILNKRLNTAYTSSESHLWKKFIQQSQIENKKIITATNKILQQVKNSGDKALIELTNKFDNTSAKKISDLIISKKEIFASQQKISSNLKNSIDTAKNRIEFYHQKQLPQDFSFKDKSGTTLGNIWKPINKIGIYAPGGTASYPSSVLMSAIPAKIAGVQDITLFAPSSGGQINPAILYCAKICGIEKIYKIGGAQAIGAMAFGTKSITKVDKIVGPGNAFVATAKKLLYGEVGIDMIAGPTDITIIADKSANPEWIAIDALSQLEHGIDSKAFIICDDINFANQIYKFINAHKINLNRYKIIEKSLDNSAIFIIKNIEDAHFLSNLIAPEHLEICVKNPQEILKNIHNAGAIFIGEYTPEAIGDYMAGPSHTLPTSGSARFSSGLSVYDFLKRMSLISCTKKSFNEISQLTSDFAECEGLTAHKLSIDIRK